MALDQIFLSFWLLALIFMTPWIVFGSKVEKQRLDADRMERQFLERERLRIEYERRREQERIMREREELRRQQEQLRFDQDRRPVKRPYDMDSRCVIVLYCRIV